MLSNATARVCRVASSISWVVTRKCESPVPVVTTDGLVPRTVHPADPADVCGDTSDWLRI